MKSEPGALSDEEQLAYAVAAQRAVFTFNTPHYLQLHAAWQQHLGREHYGIIVSDQLRIGELVRRLLNLLNRVTADEMYNQVYWLQMYR